MNSFFNPERPGKMPSTSSTQQRMEFEVDYDRIVFSSPFRSLQNKTQVVPLPEHDFVHTRLTHSLEVSSVARSLGRQAAFALQQNGIEIGSNPSEWGAIAAAAALAHDIGNPPFGHAGELALSEWFQRNSLPDVSPEESADLQSFEGNAQGFRLLTQRKDLKPTFATLGAFTKYPCPSLFEGRDSRKKSQKKFGYFQSEKAIFQEMADALELQRHAGSTEARMRHPLCWLVEAADDICYLIIDLEDAVRMGLVGIGQMVELLEPLLPETDSLNESFQKRSLDEKAGLLRAMAIRELIVQFTQAYVHHFEDLKSGSLDSSLDKLVEKSAALAHLSSFSARHIYQSERVLELQAAGFELLPKLTGMFMEAALDQRQGRKSSSGRLLNLSRMLPFQVQAEDSNYTLARQVLDCISGFSDRKAMDVYQRISGIRMGY